METRLNTIESKINQETFKLIPVKQDNLFRLLGISQSENIITSI